MKHTLIPTDRKALTINIDTNLYGTFAEIGGGQEVARHFFMAGGSANTVAKSVSAYDKSFSDASYNKNKPGRHVSEERLNKMLDIEYKQLIGVLDTRSDDFCFFTLADTVETINYTKSNYSHGWMGIKFQLNPNTPPNTVIIHLKLLENDAVLQQQTIGTIGVNLLYACKYYHDSPNDFLKSLTDNLSMDRFRITMMRMSGPDLDYVDNRLLAVQLVKNKMTQSIMFDKHGDVQQPSDMLYKKNVLALRGSFRPITYITRDILSKSAELFARDEDYDPNNTLSFCELTLNNLTMKGAFDDQDFLERINMLNAIGQNVMVSDIREYYKLVEFFSQFKIKNLRIVMGVPTFEKVVSKKYYTDLKAGILEAMAKLFPSNMKLYIYPTIKDVKGEKIMQRAKDVKMEKDVKLLIDYLQTKRSVLDLDTSMSHQLHIRSHEVLSMLQSENQDWEKYVPMNVAGMIHERGLFKSDKKKPQKTKTL
jgi:hypothetical protein